ncbi:DUF4097 family beta strand repeat-containing protein [Brevibacillus laterosporus]|uniref:DUF4097 family beta strand repeat-containing protein n=1 Tax=Brevibacillus laterosporus TaxID=1465 RepID=A0AAP8Q7Y4_BRELA|nr:DUF4097 family beta strand repeat-containing protein [Brevibacillus laterosporus]MCR8981552.1 DUF4097 domain-containing protein [Brevibacillus laterosporus]MCZ0808707.1 DUF4097 family beta strand repeat-containing protein [Brevibacillus laterosporus]MCZ0827169.1 DUF4097 family beta strand repeat-containing protein [Brevibacillus laterosporus]MCZ0850877.1 DUF4097 family beta strand repeat-containing protein [Brevibacillus laterosporus]PPA90131.1 hypothetical protein C4A77_25350 [Brevibacillu
MRKSAIIGVLFIVIGVIGCVGWLLSGGIFGQETANTTSEKTIEHPQFKQIVVDSASEDIHIVSSNDNQIKIRLDEKSGWLGTKNTELQVREENDKLLITTIHPQNWFTIDFSMNDRGLTISLPKQTWEKMKLSSTSGNITVDDVLTKEFVASSTSGDIEIERLESEKNDIQVTSGNVEISRLIATHSSFESTSGDVEVELVTGEVKANSTSGNIALHTAEVTNDLTLEASSGNIKVVTNKQPTDTRFVAKTSSGEIQTDIEGFRFNSISNDNVEATNGKEVKRTVRIETTSGDIAFKQQ